MTWDVIAGLILQMGVPAVAKLIALWENGAQVNTANFAELLAMTAQTARDRVLKVLKDNGIDPASPQGTALLAAVS